MREHQKARFEDEWPRLADELGSMLRRRGVPRWLADDIVQESGIKLWKMWDDVDPGRAVAPLGKTVAINVLRDYWRHAARREVSGSLPERAGDCDVEREGLARAELTAVSRALNKLQPSYRRVLLAEVGLADRADGGATRMLRLRARRELAGLVDRASGFGVVVGHRVSITLGKLAHRVSTRVGPREADALAYIAAVVIATVVSAAPSLGHASGTTTPDVGSMTQVGMNSQRTAPESLTTAGHRIDGRADIDRRLASLTHRATKNVKDLLEGQEKQPLVEGRLGQMGGIAAKAEVQALGVRIGTAKDGSLVVGCSDGTETGATGITRCDLGNGRTRAAADVRYRFGDHEGDLRLSTDRIHSST